MTDVQRDGGEAGSLLYLSRVCLVATLGGLLFGYDTAVISGAIGFLQTRFDLSAAEMGWAAASALFGCVIGSALAGPLSDGAQRKEVFAVWLAVFLWAVVSAVAAVFAVRAAGGNWAPAAVWEWLSRHVVLHTLGLCWLAVTTFLVAFAMGSTAALWLHGRKTVLLLSAVLFFVSAVGTALPRGYVEFFAFRIVGGIAIGAASLTSPMYIAEISPARIRGLMVSLNQFAIVSGMLVVYFVNYSIAGLGDESWNVAYGWRWMFASGAIPAAVLFGLLFTVPESPRWLTKQGRRSDALAVLARINGVTQARQEIVAIEEAIAHERSSLRQLFAPGLRAVFVIGVALAVLQQVTGINVFLYFAPEIFKSIVGAETRAALLQTVVVGAVNMLFTVIAIWTVDRLGRKPLMLVGFLGMGVCLAGLGLAAYFSRQDVWVLAFILGYIASFALSVGPVTWVILAEIFPTRIRGRAMAIATVCLWLANLVVSQTFPMMDKNEWLIARFHHGFPFFVYGLLCLVALAFVAFCVPETKGRSLEEIERQWIMGP